MVIVRKKQAPSIFVPPDALQVDIEQEGGIHRSAFGFGMELSAEDGT